MGCIFLRTRINEVMNSGSIIAIITSEQIAASSTFILSEAACVNSSTK